MDREERPQQEFTFSASMTHPSRVCYRGYSRKRHGLAGPLHYELIAPVVARIRPAQGLANQPSNMRRVGVQEALP